MPNAEWSSGPSQPRTHSGHLSGHTLTELLVVVALIAALSAVAVPSFNGARDQKLELAASFVAAAIRHARAEALRTGVAHGVTISQVTQQVTVVQWDLSTQPATALVTLTDPLSKQPYTFSVDATPATAGVRISNTQDIFDYTGLGRRRSLMFDANGTPLWTVTTGPMTHLLAEGDIRLSLSGTDRLVRVAPLTGRVTIE